MSRIFTDDIQKLANETGLSRDEALALLRRVNGDYRKALRLYQEAFTVYIEPERVEDDPHPLKNRALRLTGRVFSALRRAGGSAGLHRTLLSAAFLLALSLAPRISCGAILLLLTLRLAGFRRPCAGNAA